MRPQRSHNEENVELLKGEVGAVVRGSVAHGGCDDVRGGGVDGRGRSHAGSRGRGAGQDAASTSARAACRLHVDLEVRHDGVAGPEGLSVRDERGGEASEGDREGEGDTIKRLLNLIKIEKRENIRIF